MSQILEQTQTFAAAVAAAAPATFTIQVQPLQGVKAIEAVATVTNLAADWSYATDLYCPQLGLVLCNQPTGLHGMPQMTTKFSSPIQVGGPWTIVVRSLNAGGVMAPWTTTTGVAYQVGLRLRFIQ
jgi:hypothetical protein